MVVATEVGIRELKNGLSKYIDRVRAGEDVIVTERGGRLTAMQHADAKMELNRLLAELHIVEPTEQLIATAADLAESEALRGYDSVHLAAAVFIEASVLTSADAQLCAAAQRQGLHVANPLEMIR